MKIARLSKRLFWKSFMLTRFLAAHIFLEIFPRMETTDEVRVLPIDQWCSDTRKQEAVLSEAARVLADAFSYIER
jgi:hypothetical protein